jgi:hypothetical protein
MKWKCFRDDDDLNCKFSKSSKQFKPHSILVFPANSSIQYTKTLAFGYESRLIIHESKSFTKENNARNAGTVNPQFFGTYVFFNNTKFRKLF